MNYAVLIFKAVCLRLALALCALAWLPFAWSDYWILDLAPDYDYALVGSPSRDALWIIARKPALDPGIYERLVTKARELGFDTGKLIRMPHT